VKTTPSCSEILATDSGDTAFGTFGTATNAGEGLGNGAGVGLGRTTLGAREVVGVGVGLVCVCVVVGVLVSNGITITGPPPLFGISWNPISTQSFHVLKVVPGKRKVILAGSGGRIASLNMD
jgi:hypothetical protein